eukprot:189887-Chlamydomonas_euryale.AAC.2
MIHFWAPYKSRGVRVPARVSLVKLVQATCQQQKSRAVSKATVSGLRECAQRVQVSDMGAPTHAQLPKPSKLAAGRQDGDLVNKLHVQLIQPSEPEAQVQECCGNYLRSVSAAQ